MALQDRVEALEKQVGELVAQVNAWKTVVKVLGGVIACWLGFTSLAFYQHLVGVRQEQHSKRSPDASRGGA